MTETYFKFIDNQYKNTDNMSIIEFEMDLRNNVYEQFMKFPVSLFVLYSQGRQPPGKRRFRAGKRPPVLFELAVRRGGAGLFSLRAAFRRVWILNRFRQADHWPGFFPAPSPRHHGKMAERAANHS